jgi:uncharacterized protein (DUF1330 family)
MNPNYKIAAALVAGVALGALAVQALHAQTKPPVFLVSEIDVTNVDAYANEYIPKVRATIKAAGGRLVAVSQQVTPIEGDAPKSRITINSWESLEQIQAWRKSPDYKEARTIGDKYAKFIRSFVVEGVPQ